MKRNLTWMAAMVAAAMFASGCDDGGSDKEAAGGDSANYDGGTYGGGGAPGMAGDPGAGGGGPGQGAPYDPGFDASAPPSAAADAGVAPPPVDEDGDGRDDNFGRIVENPFVDTAVDPMSTFAVDVDTASYTIARRALDEGRLPDPDSVRIEEFINFFRYADPAPTPDDPEPFTINLEAAPSTFGEGMHLLRVGIKGLEVPAAERAPANLVFLVDVSGSMQSPDKIGLVQYSLTQLTNGLRPTDTLSIVTYAGADRVLLPPTEVGDRTAILDAIASLEAGGSTAGAAGITTAYELAQQAFVAEGINRVVLCTDGDFNVGVTGEPLVQLVESWRDRGITLTVLGYGHGNLNDDFLEQLTNRAEGQYAYIDSRNEALRMLGRDLVGTLQVIAKDVKIQVEFDPGAVARFRLVGYANRVLAHEDFRDDTVDAGEIGSGHGVTAFYEVELQPEPVVDAPLATVRLRYKKPSGGESREVETALPQDAVHLELGDASPALRFGAAVAEFAEILFGSGHSEGARFEEVAELAQSAAGEDEDRQEFVRLVNRAATLWDAE